MNDLHLFPGERVVVLGEFDRRGTVVCVEDPQHMSVWNDVYIRIDGYEPVNRFVRWQIKKLTPLEQLAEAANG